MKKLLPLLMVFGVLLSCTKKLQPVQAQNQPQKTTPVSSGFSLADMQKYTGFFTFYWDEKTGKILLEIERFDQEFLYVNSLAAGVGSNDIGLDRSQLGENRIVQFQRIGPKVLLVESNYDYRAESANPAESESVKEAFAQSVLWGFKVESSSAKSVIVDATSFILHDAHKVIQKLKDANQGTYRLDNKRSAVYLPRCKSFPKNTEFEATLTFAGNPKGDYIKDVTPTPEAVTVRQHHSFIELPDFGYQPRMYDPRSGYFEHAFRDYASAISQPLVTRYITRHRLHKKNPDAAISEAVEPIIYYLDPGTPEPVRSALLDGARWWNQAFEAAGYKDAFRVEVLPEGADPMDVRYNVIQWVHRATRGWSYGSSVIDPRTGEIIKGHVLLGSLRVRQDFLIAQGLLSPFEEGKAASPLMEQMALARLRQLSAHEVGHTIGLAHNFAASYNDRASVMDYPHPFITLKADGSLDFSRAYDDKIGAWDKRTILYGYQDFPKGTNTKKALNDILEENSKMGFKYISDADARPLGGAHPYGHLWDNGVDAVVEFERMSKVRQKALENFGLNSIPEGVPLSELGEVLVPVYLSHRYQMEAVCKLIGGVDYEYAVKGGQVSLPKVVPDQKQRDALQLLLKSIHPDFLKLPKNVLEVIPPKAAGFYRNRESFKSRTGLTFDPIAPAESAIKATLAAILHPHRANRLVQHHDLELSELSLSEVLGQLSNLGWNREGNGYEPALQRLYDQLMLDQLMSLAMDDRATAQTQALVLFAIDQIEVQLEKAKPYSIERQAHYLLAIKKIGMFKDDPSEWKKKPALSMPAGSPIGSCCFH